MRDHLPDGFFPLVIACCLRSATALWSLIFILSVQSCTTQNPVDAVVAQASLKSGLLETEYFKHRYFSNEKKGSTIYVYIGSDGTPWVNGTFVSKDPTPTNPLGLRLMALDESPAIYLGRPCYFGFSHADDCDSDVWTFGRYSEDVIESMEQALLIVLSQREAENAVLIGYSGGAVIATLLAHRVDKVRGLVTVGGNLDIALWTGQRGFLPLENSINPVDIERFREGFPAAHIVGAQDEIVPSMVTYSFVEQHGGEFWSYPNFDHRCCWEAEWPKIINRVRSAFNTGIPNNEE